MRAILIVVLCAGYFFSSGLAASCVPYSTTTLSPAYCSSVFPADYQVYLPDSATIATVDSNFTRLAPISLLFQVISDPVCRQAVLYYSCPGIYQNCTIINGTATFLPVCESECLNFLSACTSDFANLDSTDQEVANTYLPDCAGNDPITGQLYQTSNCESLTAYYASTGGAPNITNITSFSDEYCNYPLVNNPFNDSSSHPYCIGSCCIPCPLLPYFYPTGWMETVDTTCAVFAILSWLLSVFIVVAYSVLPDKNKYPAHIILNIGIALVIAYITIFFEVTPAGRNLTRCESNGIDLAAPGTSNPYAILQGITTLYGILCACLWYGFLVLNIFMSVVFLSTRLGDHPLVYHLINWSLPVISIIIMLSCHQIGYLGAGTWTLLNNGRWMDGLVMIPIALVIFPSVIINFVTLFRITQVGLRRSASAKQLIALQLRPLLFVLSILFIFIVYWTHVEATFRNNPNEDFVPDWISCVQSAANGTNAQDLCAPIAMPSLYAYHTYFFSELTINSIGIVVFAFFGFRRDVVLGLYYMFTEGKDSSFFIYGTQNRSGGSKDKKVNARTSTSTVKSSKAEEDDDFGRIPSDVNLRPKDIVMQEFVEKAKSTE